MGKHTFKCFECDKPAKHAHHVVPRVLGGTRTLPFCHSCHEKIHQLDFTEHSELTKVGIEKARANGVRIGGRGIEDICTKEVRGLRKKGLTFDEIAKKLGITKGTAIYRNNKAKY